MEHTRWLSKKKKTSSPAGYTETDRGIKTSCYHTFHRPQKTMAPYMPKSVSEAILQIPGHDKMEGYPTSDAMVVEAQDIYR